MAGGKNTYLFCILCNLHIRFYIFFVISLHIYNFCYDICVYLYSFTCITYIFYIYIIYMFCLQLQYLCPSLATCFLHRCSSKVLKATLGVGASGVRQLSEFVSSKLGRHQNRAIQKILVV